MLDGKTVLVTGGTGSFGRRFVRTLLADYAPKRVIVFSRDELKQQDLDRELADARVGYFIGDVRDRDRLYRAFQADVDVIVHAAAMKQVPACEYNPFEAIKTNILGAQNIIDAAIDCGVPKVLAISTDKAVSPANLYGATKLAAEKLFVAGNSYSGSKVTRFASVRYGNVVGSRGSVIPIFAEQRSSGRVTITDERMTRFWLTLEEAVAFVVNAIDVMEGGEVFVPRIPSMCVADLARAVAPGCEFEITGIRAGEKLHETLVSADEARRTVAHDGMYVIRPEQTFRETSRWAGLEPLPDGFVFSSDTNERWLTAEELLRLPKAA